MNIFIIRLVLVVIAAFAASFSATRADEISDLVATIITLGDVPEGGEEVSIDSLVAVLPQFIEGKRLWHQEMALFDGIYWNMRRQQIYDMADGEVDNRALTFYYTNTTDNILPTALLIDRDFCRPVPGRITSYAGWRPQFGRIHNGVDMSLCTGDTVRAAMSGFVQHVSYDSDGYGNYIVVEHPGGLETVYGHLLYSLVPEGEYVRAGQPLALGGSTGNSTGPHLHFEVRLDRVPLDPTMIFDFFADEGWTREEDNGSSVMRGPMYSHQAKSIADKSTYIVRYGDTIQSIARQAGISVMRLCQLNMLKESTSLEVGRMLKLK